MSSFAGIFGGSEDDFAGLSGGGTLSPRLHHRDQPDPEDDGLSSAVSEGSSDGGAEAARASRAGVAGRDARVGGVSDLR